MHGCQIVKIELPEYYLNKYDALEEVDAVILVTEWKEFRSPDFDKMLDLMKGNVFIDGRNQFNKDYISSAGFKYFQIGVKQFKLCQA